jgi:hypothetical protein
MTVAGGGGGLAFLRPTTVLWPGRIAGQAPGAAVVLPEVWRPIPCSGSAWPGEETAGRAVPTRSPVARFFGAGWSPPNVRRAN